MKMLAILGLAASICPLFADVKTDYSHLADFSECHTYSWIKVQASDPLWNDRIKDALNTQLSAKG